LFAHSPKIVTDGLVLALDAGNTKSYVSGSTTWFDKSGFVNNGTLTNGPTFNTGSGGSIVFDGSNDRVNNTNLLAFGNNPRTIELWIKGTGANQIPFSIGYNNGSNTAFALNIASTTTVNIYGQTDPMDENNIPVSVNFTNGAWHQAAVTWNGADPGTLLIYGDGNQVGTRTRTAGKSYNTVAGYYVGGWSDGNRFYNGQIALARIYNRALSAQEVSQNFNALRGRFGI
jgi:hypothetical protein